MKILARNQKITRNAVATKRQHYFAVYAGRIGKIKDDLNMNAIYNIKDECGPVQSLLTHPRTLDPLENVGMNILV